MNEFLILLVLKLNPSNIYEIKKFIDTNFQPFLQVSIGAIMPALKRLEQAGYVLSEKSMTDGGLKRNIYYQLEQADELIEKYLSEDITSSPQLARREIEILLYVLSNVVEKSAATIQENISTQSSTAEQLKIYDIDIIGNAQEYNNKSINSKATNFATQKIVLYDKGKASQYAIIPQNAENWNVFTDEQIKLLYLKIKNALDLNIKQLKKSIKFSTLNTNFTEMELSFAEAKLNYLISLVQ